jgi:hypothetical protein
MLKNGYSDFTMTVLHLKIPSFAENAPKWLSLTGGIQYVCAIVAIMVACKYRWAIFSSIIINKESLVGL